MATPRTGRPRGRPPGSKNKPKTIEEFVLTNAIERPQAPPKRVKAPARGPWAGMTPEERTAYSAKLRAAQRPDRPRPGSRPGRPPSLNEEQHDALLKQVRPEIERIKKKMAETDQLPDDPRAVQVLDKALETFLVSTSANDVTKLGRLILDFTKAKPAQKHDVNVRTHEDFLDDLASEDSPSDDE